MTLIQPGKKAAIGPCRAEGLGARNEGADHRSAADRVRAQNGEGIAMLGFHQGVDVGLVEPPRFPRVAAQRPATTGTFHISSAYSRMVRSEEKKPMWAVLSMDERHQAFSSRHLAATARCVAV